MKLFLAGAAGADVGGRLAGLDAVDLILQAGPVVKLVLLLLVVFSVVSWAIIVQKWRELRRAQQDSEAFLEVYRDESLSAAYEAARDLDRSPLAAVFLAGSAEANRFARYGGGATLREGGEEPLRAVTKQLEWAAARESERLERGLSFLATTGSSTPFIGLFGTVVGIIDAFQGIGRAGSASLAVVAPGIAEALIATAVGLLAAIPATIFYNHFVGRLQGVQRSIDLFRGQLEGDLARRGGPLASADAPSARAKAK
jgi:biopolymer transport protein TolQ